MRRKFIALGAALLMLGLWAQPAVTGGAGAGCNTTNLTDTLIWYVKRAPGAGVTGMTAETTVVNLVPANCASGVDTNMSAVFPANVQDVVCNASGGTLAQVGYGIVDGGLPLRWLYTPYAYAIIDGKCGHPSYVLDAPFEPVVGQAYRFQVFPSSIYTDRWAFTVTRLSDGAAFTRYGYEYLGDNTVSWAWAGIEIHNYNDQFGANSASAAVISNMKWRSTSATYYWFTGTTDAAWANLTGPGLGEWNEGVGTGIGGSTRTHIWGWDAAP